jgi:hypothetical protein
VVSGDACVMEAIVNVSANIIDNGIVQLEIARSLECPWLTGKAHKHLDSISVEPLTPEIISPI